MGGGVGGGTDQQVMKFSTNEAVFMNNYQTIGSVASLWAMQDKEENESSQTARFNPSSSALKTENDSWIKQNKKDTNAKIKETL